ncbi:MAG TPA: hypothetical protein VGD08_05875 [Stellaceae bacterium]|jgi:hypothetical protein
MSALDETVCDKCREALSALDRATKDRADHVYDDLVEATRCLVRLRDELIGRRRKGEDVREALDRTNAVLSAVTGAEYPLAGVKRERIKKARDALESLLHDV